MIRKFVPSIIRRRYAARFAVVFLVTLAVIATIGWLNFTDVDRTVKNSTETRLKTAANLKAETLGNWIQNQKRDVRTISAAGQLRGDVGNRSVTDYLSQRSTDSKAIREIHVLNLSGAGTVVASTNPRAVGQSRNEMEGPWASATLSPTLNDATAVWASDTSYSTAGSNEQVMAFVSRVPGHPDRSVVVVSSLHNPVRQLYKISGDQATSVVNGEDEVVMNSTGSELIGAQSGTGGIPVNTTTMKRVAQGETVFVTDGGRAFAYAPVPETDGWAAVTSLPNSEAFAVKRAVTRSVAVIIGVALLALGGFGVVIGYQTIRPLSTLRARAERMEEGDLDVDLQTNREDEIGRLYGSFDAMRDALKNRIREAEQAREEAERSRERVERLNQHLEQKAGDYSTVMRRCAEGDLTQRLDPASQNESMEEIAEAFNEMLDDIEGAIERVQQFAGDVASASEEVTASAEEVRNASQEVSESVQEISDGAHDQDERLQTVAEEMNSLSTTTEEIASSSNEVAEIAERTANTGREGREAAQDAAEGMEEIRRRSAEIVEASQQLDDEMEGIDELTDFIQDVAKETNMLALNANIEASRGGGGEDGGEGFAAVAEKIKQLAEDTQDAAEDIEQRLVRIQEQTDETVGKVADSSDRIDENAESIENAIDALDDIAEFAQETNEGVQEISAASEEQASSVEEVVAMVDEVATIGERTAEESESVASAAEEQTAAMSDVSESASDLAERAGELSEALDRFTTGAADGPGTNLGELGGRERTD